jgi:hypothetical protein
MKLTSIQHMHLDTVREIVAEMEIDGLVEQTGEFRRSPYTGELGPVYRLTVLGEAFLGAMLPKGSLC